MISAKASDTLRGGKPHTIMLRICADSNILMRLGVQSPASIDEAKRKHLLDCIANAPDVFFDEIGEKFLLLGANLPGFDPGDSMDLLALDPNGNVSVIELSGRAAQQQLMRALSHAALISKCSRDRLLTGVDAGALMKFILVHTDQVNRRQRVVLAASSFDDDVLIAAEWLSGTYGVDIVCIRITVMLDPVARTEYLECDRLFPVKQQAGVRTHAAQPVSPVGSVDRRQDTATEDTATSDTDFGGWADLASLSEGVAWR
jgi:hypothetical protein